MLCPHPGDPSICTTGLLEGWDAAGVRACHQGGQITGKHRDFNCLQSRRGSLVEPDLGLLGGGPEHEEGAASGSTNGNHSVICDQKARWKKPEASWELGQAVPGPGTGVALRSPGGHLASERGGHPSLPHPTGLGSQGRGAPTHATRRSQLRRAHVPRYLSLRLFSSLSPSPQDSLQPTCCRRCCWRCSARCASPALTCAGAAPSSGPAPNPWRHHRCTVPS